jgi:hypothetical protein
MTLVWIFVAMPLAGLICFAFLIGRTGKTHGS